MADTLLMPDVEQLVIQFLIDDLDVADIFDGRIYSELPTAKDWPAARVGLFYDQEVTRSALWLVRSMLQIDVWGGSKSLARLGADTIRDALKNRLPGSHEDGIVTHVETRGRITTSDNDVPTEKGKPRPRVRFNADVWAHPARYASS